MGGQCYREPGKPQTDDEGWNRIIFDDEKIIDDQQLFQVNPDMGKKMLHRNICAIRFAAKKSGSKFGEGSGVLLSNNLVLTAAHIIYDKNADCEYDKAGYKVYVGAVGQADAYYKIQDWRFPDEYRSCDQDYKLKSDFALLKLSQEVKCNEFVQVSLPCDCIFSKREEIRLKVYGYPHLNNYKLLDEFGRIKLSQFGLSLNKSIVNVEADKFVLAHKVSTLSGQSGCPVVVDDKVIAIHTGAKADDEFNIGRLVTQGVLSYLKQWTSQLNGKPIKISENMSCSQCDALPVSLPARPLPPSQPQPPLAPLTNTIQLDQNSLKVLEEKTQLAVDLYLIGRREYSSQPPNYASALNYFLQSQEIFTKIAINSLDIAEVKQKIGMMYAFLKNFDNAFEYYRESQRIYQLKEGRNSFEYGTLQMNIGVCYSINMHYKSSQQHLETALSVFNKLNDQKHIKSCALQLARVLVRLKEMDKLEKIMNKYQINQSEIEL